MITKEFREVAAEIDEILGYLPLDYIEKIPLKLREFFEKIKIEDYKSNINPYKPLDEQDIKPKTKTLLTVLYRNYWCSKEERAELDKILVENDVTYEQKLREKYNPDDIFKKKEKDEEIKEVEETNLVVYENKVWYQKAINFVSSIFKKLFRKKAD